MAKDGEASQDMVQENDKGHMTQEAAQHVADGMLRWLQVNLPTTIRGYHGGEILAVNPYRIKLKVSLSMRPNGLEHRTILDAVEDNMSVRDHAGYFCRKSAEAAAMQWLVETEAFIREVPGPEHLAMDVEVTIKEFHTEALFVDYEVLIFEE